ncbi:hypothetical protein HMPREF1569_5319 [Klebsiella oxytoca OK-1]|nr:hypothetical protein HMPREF1569_5319 [Klebsiella oxytoca OK-1]
MQSLLTIQRHVQNKKIELMLQILPEQYLEGADRHILSCLYVARIC